MSKFSDGTLAVLAGVIVASLATPNSAQVVQRSPADVVADVGALDLRQPKPLSRDEEKAIGPMDPFQECAHCPEMVVVPDGVFTMGANESEPGSVADERPQHQVTVQRFGVGRFPVTYNEWNACVMAKGCSYR